jgi:hypothetical protein
MTGSVPTMTERIEGLDVYAASSYRVAVSSGKRVTRKVPLVAGVDTETGEVTFSVAPEDIEKLQRD